MRTCKKCPRAGVLGKSFCGRGSPDCERDCLRKLGTIVRDARLRRICLNCGSMPAVEGLSKGRLPPTFQNAIRFLSDADSVGDVRPFPRSVGNPMIRRRTLSRYVVVRFVSFPTIA